MKQLIKNHLLYFCLYGIIWLILLFWVLSHSKLEQMLLINKHYNTFADYFFVAATQLGEGWFFVAIILAFLFISYDKALMLAGSLALSSILSSSLKFSFDTLRPLSFLADKHIKWHLVEGLQINIHLSFPSGHTTTAFAIFTMLTLFYRNKNWSILFLTLAWLAGYSRCYLFQHFPEDVLGGSVVGTLSSLLIYIWISNMLGNNPKEWHNRKITLQKNPKSFLT